MKLLAFIPARSGSQSIKNKNMRLFHGKPLIHHTVIQAKKISGVKVFVSTDSKKILKSTKKFGCEQSYLRPKKLSLSSSNIIDAIIHGLNWLEDKKRLNFDAVILLQPTSPLRSVKDLDRAINIFKKKKLKSLVGVSRMREHPYDCVQMKGRSWNFLKTNLTRATNRQQYKDSYFYINGSLYISDVKILLEKKRFVIKNLTKLFFTDYKSSFEIDYITDFKIAESLVKKKN